MTFFKKKLIVYHLVMLGLVILFSAGAVAFILRGSRVYSRASKDLFALGEQHSSLMSYTLRIQAETSLIREAYDMSDNSTFKARLGELVYEADNIGGILASTYSSMNMRKECELILGEIKDIIRTYSILAEEDPVEINTIARLHEKALTLEVSLADNYTKAKSNMEAESRRGKTIMYFSGICMIIALIAGVFLVTSFIKESF